MCVFLCLLKWQRLAIKTEATQKIEVLKFQASSLCVSFPNPKMRGCSNSRLLGFTFGWMGRRNVSAFFRGVKV